MKWDTITYGVLIFSLGVEIGTVLYMVNDGDIVPALALAALCGYGGFSIGMGIFLGDEK